MRVLKCTSCDLLLQEIPVQRGFSARCPTCDSRVIKNSSLSRSGEVAIAFAALALFFPAQLFPLLSINLVGVPLSTTVTSGAITLMDSFPFVGLLVIFCTAFAPLLFLVSILGANLALSFHHAKSLFVATYCLKVIKHWVMIDVFLVSLAVAGFKVIEIAEISVGPALLSFVMLQVLVAFLLSRISPKRYWDAYSINNEALQDFEMNKPSNHVGNRTFKTETLIRCQHCGLTQESNHQHCFRCSAKLESRVFQSVQKTWASLLAAVIFIFPANFYPISILLSNGKRFEDTIFSGVAGLIKQGMYGIAIIIFTASIIVPVAKIVGLLYILICIHLKVTIGRRQRMKMYRFVKWIGKWSMMDLCVIAIMVSLIDRGNLLDFTPGPGAIAFGLVVVLTMISAESLDSRLIWDKHEQR
ncbi:paraquat-inducible protein A [Enterovibrio norvegicus FF-33]|uniref:Paraquat-inducible protein A n=1 Tax=Enterovibrio norvegicus FF-454 TaxID=1185651 RepID=A0A1E5C9R5_9GAMM|nr:paraquat-inducible protein A [Enterovibrio norvegicus]OEE62219.1 paraquat-inducible protein A [Enterovibrio norvegicus FF-454]OEE65804.1 paraquat-inducible protein A [Enterovibrio norvegicus FF-33]OEE89164.1 paraquat-inducible protein A [Enterovibrio norvegicus FF-162]